MTFIKHLKSQTLFKYPYLCFMSNIKDSSKPYSVIILAAGNSSRMQSPKFALQFDENHTFLEEIIAKYHQFGCKEIIVVLNKKGKTLADNLNLKLDKATISINQHPEWERFYSIKLGVRTLTKQQPVFIHNVDNPFVNASVLENLLEQDVSTDYVVPTYKSRGGHPILVSNEICKAILSEKENDLILSSFLKKFTKNRIAVPDEKVLLNINTKEIYHKNF